LNAGEQHKVWRPTPLLPPPVTNSRPLSKLLPQKSKPQLLADRKKILDNRLQATREALKMQNMEEAQITATAQQGAKPSFSDVSRRVKSNIALKKKNMEVCGKAITSMEIKIHRYKKKIVYYFKIQCPSY